MEHSVQYEALKEKWEHKYITEATLRKFVALHAKNEAVGITAEEFTEITGIEF